MAALSTLGIVHTAIALVAVGAGIRAFIRYKEISHHTGAGLLYIGMTVLTCLTGFFIFAHGGPTAAHALGVLTLLVLGFAAAIRRLGWLGRHGRAVQMLAYSLSFFFHFIPGLTETGTRLPAGAPVFSGHDDPALIVAVSVCFVIYVLGAVAQLRWLRENEAPLPMARPRMPAA
jgi:uncharacterized membrane protein